jgi:hypothetical protein
MAAARRGHRITRSVTALGVIAPLAALASFASTAGAGEPASRSNVQPAPAVSATSFPLEPTGHAPVDGDGLIPNPLTPTGSAVAPPATCSIKFSSASGATSATVNAWIQSHDNGITRSTVVCLMGTFGQPLHIWGKTSTALLEVAPAPDSSATFDLGTATAADADPNHYWSDSGGISIVDSRSVEIYGLTVENFTFNGAAHVPAGIYVTVRSDTKNVNQDKAPHRSACFLSHSSCSDIYIIRNTVENITNGADEIHYSKSVCGNSDVGAYGIAVIAAGSKTSPALQHVVVEDNTVEGTHTGQSETVTMNGNLKDFLVAGNSIHDVDNIGIDTIGWELGSSQANHGYVASNTVYNVDTWTNSSYGRWTGSTCAPGQENAAALYDDGGSYIWFNANTVRNADQGINLDVETPHRETDHILVSGNTVYDDPGTSSSDPSIGSNPPGSVGISVVAGHDPYAMYVDAFGAGATIEDVYIHDNVFQNESQYDLTPADGMPVVALGGRWSDVELWHNTIEGRGTGDRFNPLLEVDQQPTSGRNVIDCNKYGELSTSAKAVDGNFALPSGHWLTLAQWRAHNGHRWDRHSEVGGFSPACPARTLY